MSKSFQELGVSAPVATVLQKQGITHPFAIQNLVLPDALAGLDIALWDLAGKVALSFAKFRQTYSAVGWVRGDVQTKDAFGDCQLHVEWAAPAQVQGDSQGRGNSGIFLMGLAEVQVLDNYNNPTYADGFAASVRRASRIDVARTATPDGLQASLAHAGYALPGILAGARKAESEGRVAEGGGGEIE